MSASTGEAINEVLPACLTLTFQLPKICHYVSPASLLCGEVRVLDIGIWPEVIDQLAIQRFLLTEGWFHQSWTPPAIHAHKGTQGHLLLIGGSRNMAGAVALAGKASLKSGAGLCTLFTPESCRVVALSTAPELMCVATASTSAPWLHPEALDLLEAFLAGKQAVALGPGMGTHPETAEFMEGLLPRIQVPLVLDADGLNLLSRHPDWWNMLPDSTILTPHPGEMKRLTGLDNVSERRLEIAERLAQDRNVIVVLKGAGSIVALPDGTSYVNTSGNPGMATAGSGDVLTGMIGAILARGVEPGIAAALGVYLHGKAGDVAATSQGVSSLIATDIIRHIRI